MLKQEVLKTKTSLTKFDVYLEFNFIIKIQIQLIRNKNKTHRHVHCHTYGKLKAHRESVPLKVSTTGIIVFKNCAFGDYPPNPPMVCKI